MSSGGHMDVTRDTTGAEVIVWTNSNDANPIPCENGIVKVRLSDAQQTCLRELDWSLAVHVSCPDSGAWCFVGTFAPGEPSPTSWPAFTNELLQVKLDGSETRRLAHHRSRALNDYNYMPKATVSRDGTRVVFGSNHDLQNILRYPTEYSDAFLVTVPASGGGGGTTVPGPTPTPTPAPTPAPTPTGGGGGTTAGTTIRIEENGAGVTRSAGHWYDNVRTYHSGGNAILAMDTGAWVQLAFKGVGAKWIGYRDEWAGIARVYVDGVLKATIDTAGTGQSKQVLYTVDNLADANHTLKIEVTGSIGPSSTAPWVWIDGFDVVTGSGGTTGDTGGTTPTVTTGWSRVQANGATYTGTWYDNVHTWHSGGSAKLAMLAGDQARFQFTGTGVRWIGYRDEWAGMAKVYVDGVLMKKVDTYSSTGKSQQVIYSVEGLAKKAHTLRVYVTGTKNRKSDGKWVWIDAFDVKP
jgi:hypothetical protein